MSAKSQITWLAVAELLAMTLWFSATAVTAALQAEWGFGSTGAAWLTASVQLGFVLGALVAARFNLADVFAPRALFAVSALLGATANLALAWGVDSLPPALLLRFLTGITLAGVYPPGMKIAAGHVAGHARGLAIGVLVGALTLGSATPHLVAGLIDPAGLSFRAVLTTSSVLAVCGAILVRVVVRDGPFAAPSAPFDPSQCAAVLKNRGLRLANLGYLGHMWELYAVWTWLYVFLLASLGPGEPAAARIIAFASIGVAGALGAALGGALADRIGRTRLTIWAMAVSGNCCLLSPWFHGAALPVLALFGFVWGVSVVADSAQFSAAVTELAAPPYLGTALALQTALGFALTMVTIWALPLIAEALGGWRYAFVVLAPGPFLGCVAMARLRRSPDAGRLAGGRG